jgi:competence protein ComEA
VIALARSAPPPPAPPRSAIAEAPLARGPIDLNTADAAALATLPRIGPTLAARIVADRSARGPFDSVDALDRVPGVGPRTIEELRPHVRVDAARPP